MKSVAVRVLCDFAARTGSLEFRYTPAPSSVEGIVGHRTVQERRADPYIAEYALEAECEGIQVGGRVDGYYANRQCEYLEEIKTHRGNVTRIGPGKRALHWAQLKVYGALFCRRNGRERIRLRLTFFEVRREEESCEDVEFEAEELWAFLVTLCRRYNEWQAKEQAHRLKRDAGLQTLAFPHETFRDGQRSLSETVYKAIATARPLLLQAPTGIGKTVGVLYPTLRAMPTLPLDKVFYLSCRNTGKRLALDGLRAIVSTQGETQVLRVLELSSMERSCEHPESACHGDSCPLALDFFEKLEGARDEAVEQGWLDEAALTRIARKHQLCRYFLAQEMAQWSDVIVADVNHYFDQHALLYALTEHHAWRVVPLVDEAHNLIDRARSMYSLKLSESELLYTIAKPPRSLQKPLQALEAAWTRLTRPYLNQAGEAAILLDTVPDGLNDALSGLISAITDYLTDYPRAGDIQQVLFTAAGFLRLAEQFSDHSLCTLSFDVAREWQSKIQGSAALSIDNVIPADHLVDRFKAAVSVVLFSATLEPMNYYRDMLGLPDHTAYEDIPSPFQASQIELRLVTSISTRSDHRERTLPRLATRVVRQYTTRPGNYLVYLSSFAYVDALANYLQLHHPEVRVVKQTSGMTTEARNTLIAAVSDSVPSIGICVLGGVFGEGIDLPGDQLIGVFVATLGLPPHDEFNERLRNTLEARFGQGYNYTYLYPGLTKVVQAGGRLIRTPADTGLIELIDDRYRRTQVCQLLPSWWGRG